MANPLLVNVAELLRRPGTDKPFELEVRVADLDVADARFAADDSVTVTVRLESLSDGIVVDGIVRAPWHSTCRRCLGPATGELDSEVHELYQQVVTDPEAFPIVLDQVDLHPMVREVVLLDAPLAPLCRADCAGLCPTCGIDLNQDQCDCPSAPVDHRWSALDDLKSMLPEGFADDESGNLPDR